MKFLDKDGLQRVWAAVKSHSPVLTEPFTVAKNWGNIRRGTTFPAGTTLESILRDMLRESDIEYDVFLHKADDNATAYFDTGVTLSTDQTIKVIGLVEPGRKGALLTAGANTALRYGFYVDGSDRKSVV